MRAWTSRGIPALLKRSVLRRDWFVGAARLAATTAVSSRRQLTRAFFLSQLRAGLGSGGEAEIFAGTSVAGFDSRSGAD